MRWLRLWKTRILLILAVLGPGFITANVDNDAGGIYTYSFAGARYGYTLLWTIIPMAISLSVMQEMAARMGAVTGKGLSDLIREEFGLRITFLMMLALVLTNFGNIMAEFAGVASSLELFGISKFASVPIAAALVSLLVMKGTYQSVEKIFLIGSFLYIAYIIAAFLSGPNWFQAAAGVARPPSWELITQPGYLYFTVGIIGATIAPWQQFYLQSSVVEKGVRLRQLAASRIDAIFGAVFSVVVAGFIIIVCAATLHVAGHHEIHDAADAAYALRPLAGKYASILFAFGLFNASLFAASVLPLSTAYTVCEGLGLESGIDKRFSEARGFYSLYAALIAGGAGAILWPDFPLLKITVLSQVLNGILLPCVLFFMVKLVNKRELMGDHVNSRLYNIIAWTTAGGTALLSLALVWLS